MDERLVNELYHFGVKGMKWGVRRFRNKDGTLTEKGKNRLERDTKKLLNTSNKYYDAINRYNVRMDTDNRVYPLDEKKILRDVKAGELAVEKMVSKLTKKYGNASVSPVFQKNGYVVERVEAMITNLDKQGRISLINQSSHAISNYDHLRDEYRLLKAKDVVDQKYSKKMASAKTKEEKERLSLDWEDEIEKTHKKYPTYR